MPCSKYLIRVRAIEKGTFYEAMPDARLRIKTQYDHKLPPSNATMEKKEKGIYFSWEHNCNIASERPPYYLFRIHDITINKSDELRVDGLGYRFEKFALGAEYNFSVSAPASDAVPATWHFVAPPLPAPTNLRISHAEANRYTLEWEPVADIDEE